MHTMLTVGDTVTLRASQQSWRVESLLGAGGQGEVYRIVPERRRRQGPLALKWYHPWMATPAQRAALQELVRRGQPDRRFLWPLDLAEGDVGGFGYVMPLRPDRFVSMAGVMSGDATPSFRATATAGYQVSDAYLALHARGWCYRDINFNNVFLDPADGEVMVCDNDNVAVDGVTPSTVSGTAGFMAPEIVRGDAMPSVATDLYSLSVLLFHLFFVHHPLLGRRELDEPSLDGDAMRRLYGEHPVFVFDPDDRSNEPVPGYHDNAIIFWSLYPDALRQLFIRAFTHGLRDPQDGRVRETEWRREILRLRDACTSCPTCGHDSFWDEAAAAVPDCWHCGATIGPPLRIQLDDPERTVVVLNRDTKLFPHHIGGRPFDFAHVMAEVTPDPSRTGVWGLTNRSDATWTAVGTNEVEVPVPPGRTVRLAAGTSVGFGPVHGLMTI